MKTILEGTSAELAELQEKLHTGTITRREFLRYVALLGLSVGVAEVLTACGGKSTPTPPSILTPTSTRFPTGTPIPLSPTATATQLPTLTPIPRVIFTYNRDNCGQSSVAMDRQGSQGSQVWYYPACLELYAKFGGRTFNVSWAPIDGSNPQLARTLNLDSPLKLDLGSGLYLALLMHESSYSDAPHRILLEFGSSGAYGMPAPVGIMARSGAIIGLTVDNETYTLQLPKN